MTLPPPPPFPDPTISEMISDRIDLHAVLDGLLREFHQHNAGLRLKPELRTSWGELRLDIEARLSRTTGTCDMGDARMAIACLQDDILEAIEPFAKKYAQAQLDLVFDYIQDEAQATLNLHF
jgi:hypothetical protein